MEDRELHEHELEEHEHHHGNHHDDACGCGCDHDHHHDHDHHDHDHHDHDHDHDHHHHAHACDDPNCTDPSHHHHHHHDDGPVHISHHESSTIGAMKGVMPTADYDAAETALAAQMREAGRQITEAGGIIGHIKFVLTAAGKCGQISVTDVDENIRRFEGGTSTVEGVAIVFAIEDEALTEILTHTIGSLFAENA